MSADQLCSQIKNGKMYYEVIPDDVPIKLYFDIDLKLDENDMEYFDIELAPYIEEEGMNYIKKGLKELYPDFEPNIAHNTSHSGDFTDVKGKRQAKYSVHYFVSNIKTRKTDNKNFVYFLNKIVNDVPTYENRFWDVVTVTKK